MLGVTDVRKRFGEIQALDGCTFAVERGRMLGFLGPNGAGKTTAMRTIFGLVVPNAGEVLWDGRPIGVEERLRFGYMPEERGLYPRMRVGEQVAYFGTLHGLSDGDARTAAARWLERLGLAGRADAKVEELSHGNRQRAQLAAALLHEPELLVLDEPFSGLDPVGVDVLAEVLLERVRSGVAVLFSSHQLELVERLCDGVAIVDGGRLVAAGTVEQLRASRTRDRWTVQLEGAGPETVTGTDPDAILDAARARGTVVAFSRLQPTLAELFRESVEA